MARLHADHVTRRMARGPAGDPRAFPRPPRLSAARSIVQSSSSSHRSTRSSFANGPERGARPGISDGSVPTGTRRTPAAAAVGHRRPGPAAPRPTPHPGMARDQTGMEEIDHRTSRLRIVQQPCPCPSYIPTQGSGHRFSALGGDVENGAGSSSASLSPHWRPAGVRRSKNLRRRRARSSHHGAHTAGRALGRGIRPAAASAPLAGAAPVARLSRMDNVPG